MGNSLSFNPLEYPLCLEVPQRLTLSTWHGHIPFAFALVQMLRPKKLVELGVQRGDSYFAFCQAVRTAGLSTSCYAVDTWLGDPHAGFYDEVVFEEFKAYHDAHFSTFSTVIRKTFDEALPHFADGSIDLLHIDGFHNYEAVAHDFEAWLPKLSAAGVMLLHDVNVFEKDFGVWRLWEEVRQRYPSFEFKHGYGLGVLAVGEIPDALRPFFGEEGSRSSIFSFFARLGEQMATLREQGRLLTEIQADRQQILEQLRWREDQLMQREEHVRWLEEQQVLREDRVRQLEEQRAQREENLKQLERQLHSKTAQAEQLQRDLDNIWQHLQALRGTRTVRLSCAAGKAATRFWGIGGSAARALLHRSAARE